MKLGTVALIVRFQGPQAILLDTLSDDQEIHLFEAAIHEGHNDPLEAIYKWRAKQAVDDEDFGDYVEDLISRPFIRTEIREHGIQWFKSRMRIQQYREHEAKAAQVIASYALKLFEERPSRNEFVLAGPKAKVRILVFTLEDSREKKGTSVA